MTSDISGMQPGGRNDPFGGRDAPPVITWNQQVAAWECPICHGVNLSEAEDYTAYNALDIMNSRENEIRVRTPSEVDWETGKNKHPICHECGRDLAYPENVAVNYR